MQKWSVMMVKDSEIEPPFTLSHISVQFTRGGSDTVGVLKDVGVVICRPKGKNKFVCEIQSRLSSKKDKKLNDVVFVDSQKVMTSGSRNATSFFAPNKSLKVTVSQPDIENKQNKVLFIEPQKKVK